jgi:hypothetical protein
VVFGLGGEFRESGSVGLRVSGLAEREAARLGSVDALLEAGVFGAGGVPGDERFAEASLEGEAAFV